MGLAGLFSRRFSFATVVVGLMGALAQFLNYYLNTWLPVLMEQAGFNTKGSLAFLLVLSGGAIIGSAGRLPLRRPVRAQTGCGGLLPDRCGVHRTTDTGPAAAVRLPFVAIVGFGTTGTSILIYGLVANHFPTRMRAAAVAWAAGFGRLRRCQWPAARRSVPGRRSRGELGLLCPGRPGPRGCLPDVAGPKSQHAIDIHSTPVEPSVPVGAASPQSQSRRSVVARITAPCEHPDGDWFT